MLDLHLEYLNREVKQTRTALLGLFPWLFVAKCQRKVTV